MVNAQEDYRLMLVECVMCHGELTVDTATEATAAADIKKAQWRVVHLEPRLEGLRTNALVCKWCVNRFRPGGMT